MRREEWEGRQRWGTQDHLQHRPHPQPCCSTETTPISLLQHRDHTHRLAAVQSTPASLLQHRPHPQHCCLTDHTHIHAHNLLTFFLRCWWQLITAVEMSPSASTRKRRASVSLGVPTDSPLSCPHTATRLCSVLHGREGGRRELDTRTHTRTHVCTHAHMYACKHNARMHTRTRASTRACTHACTHARTHASMHARIHVRTHACMHARTHAHTHACTYARTHSRTHARTHWSGHSQLCCYPVSTYYIYPVSHK